MNLSPQAWLAAGIVALYLYDCAVLLHWNEALLVSPWQGKWLALFGTRGFTVNGSEVSLGTALLPGVPVFRVHWSPESNGREDGGWEQRSEALRPVQLASLSVFLSTILVFPAALLLRVGDGWLLVLLGLVYASLVGTLLIVWVHRARLDVSGKALAGLAFEVLACPPLGASFTRKLSMKIPVPEDFVCAARRLLKDGAVSESLLLVEARIRDEMETEEEGSERFCRLRTRAAELN